MKKLSKNQRAKRPDQDKVKGPCGRCGRADVEVKMVRVCTIHKQRMRRLCGSCLEGSA